MIMNRKIVKRLCLILICFFGFIPGVVADPVKEVVAENFCTDIKQTLQLVGVFVLLLRIAVPLIIVFMGSLDFYKSVTSGDAAEVKKGAIMIGKRIILGFLVFYLTTFVNLVVSNLGNKNADYQVCIDCIDKPLSCN